MPKLQVKEFENSTKLPHKGKVVKPFKEVPPPDHEQSVSSIPTIRTKTEMSFRELLLEQLNAYFVTRQLTQFALINY